MSDVAKYKICVLRAQFKEDYIEMSNGDYGVTSYFLNEKVAKFIADLKKLAEAYSLDADELIAFQITGLMFTLKSLARANQMEVKNG